MDTYFWGLLKSCLPHQNVISLRANALFLFGSQVSLTPWQCWKLLGNPAAWLVASPVWVCSRGVGGKCRCTARHLDLGLLTSCCFKPMQCFYQGTFLVFIVPTFSPEGFLPLSFTPGNVMMNERKGWLCTYFDLGSWVPVPWSHCCLGSGPNSSHSWFSLFPVSGNSGSRQSCFPCSQLEVSEEFEGKGACLHLDSTLQGWAQSLNHTTLSYKILMN